MKKELRAIATGLLLLLSQSVFSQRVKLAKIGLGMSEGEVRAALESTAPHYIDQPSSSELHYLIAETPEESFAFTFIEGRVAAFSLMHFIPAGQQPFLTPGQEPSVKILRDLIVRQTWVPAVVDKGDTFWFSDATGAPLSDKAVCAPKSGTAWVPFTTLADAIQKPTAGLLKPALVSYAPNCGASIHLEEMPAQSENDRVDSVRIQVLDLKAMNGFVASRHKQ